MIDYALCIQPVDKVLRRRITMFVQHLSHPIFNHTLSCPLMYAPAAVSIETKAKSGDRAEARAQLGLWVASWQKRLASMATDLGVPISCEEEDGWNEE
jgi:hypothetical protein